MTATHSASTAPAAGTRRGTPARQPDGTYELTDLVAETPAGFEVTVIGEDGRRRTFKFKSLPLAGWHPQLAHALARCTSTHGIVRTVASAATVFAELRSFLTAMSALPDPPNTPSELAVSHLKQYWLLRRGQVKMRTLHHEIWGVRIVFEQVPDQVISKDVDAWLHRRLPAGEVPSVAGYSDREFEAIMAAARSEVAAIRARLRRGRMLLTRLESDPASLTADERQLAQVLAPIATSGEVPVSGNKLQPWDEHPMMLLAQNLFVTDFDLGPLMTLAVGLSGRNSETIKDLTAGHDLLENKAVRVKLIKRRRGPGGMTETVHWEVGTPSQQLQRPGGFYLLMEQMMRPSRAFSATPSLWSVWNPRRGHYGPFDSALHLKAWHMARWKRHLTLLDDDGQPLEITLPRLKKTVDIRNTRAAGGHLPSSVRSNTMPVLFTNYLRGDVSVRDWASDVITAALADAETQAHACHARVLADSTSTPVGIAEQLHLTDSTAVDLMSGELNTAFAACADIEHSPIEGGRHCSASFLMCFGCTNALVTHQHIPRLKGLLDWMVDQRAMVDTEFWWRRYGPAWSAITDHIRPKFTPAEWDHAATDAAVSDLMTLLDGPQEA